MVVFSPIRHSQSAASSEQLLATLEKEKKEREREREKI